MNRKFEINRKVKNVLIFPAGTEVAFEIHSALKYSRLLKVYGGVSVSCHAQFVFENYIDGIPFFNEDSFIDCLNDVIDKYHIDYVYPADDGVQFKLTKEQYKLNATVVTSSWQTVEICRSKAETYKALGDASYLPKTYKSINEITSYPVFIKPSVGQASQGAYRIDSAYKLSLALSERNDYVISEFLPGVEYSVDCFTDRHGKLRVAKLRQRERIRNGISVRSRILKYDESVWNIAQDINFHFEFNGAWFFQLKKNANGEYRLMEVSPRVPGTMGASRNLGINFPLLTIFNLMDYDVDIIDNDNELVLDRAYIRRFETSILYKRIYLDFDDTIIVRDKVNTQLMMFLYQAVNEGKEIYLLTKHNKDIYESIDKYKLSEKLFDEIIHISPDKEKSDYITTTEAIFIDDAFSERKKIHDIWHIPVFDIDAIESLINYRL